MKLTKYYTSHPQEFEALGIKTLQWYRIQIPPPPGPVRITIIDRPPQAESIALSMHPN